MELNVKSWMDAAEHAAKSTVDAAKTASNSMKDATSDAVKSIKDSASRKIQERQQRSEDEKMQKQAEKERKAELASGCYFEDGMQVVSTVEGMRTWLCNLGKDTTPALMETLQVQLQVLQSVQSPTMTGMAIDNMILCLDKALGLSTDKKETDNIREAFASMLQNYMFFQEANVRYASIKNKKDANDLLEQAGNMLSKAVVKTAVAVSQGNLVTAALDVRNIFDSDETRKGYFSKLFLWYADKKAVKEKEENFYKMVESLFDIYDQNAELLAPSILTKGMLGRYRKSLTDYRKQVAVEQYVKRHSQFEPSLIEMASKEVVGIVNGSMNRGSGVSSDIAQSFKRLAEIASGLVNDRKREFDINAYCLLVESLSREISSLKQQLAVVEGERDVLTGKLSGAGLLQFSLKKEVQSQLEDKKAEITVIKNALQPLQDKLTGLNAAFPEAKAIRDDIVVYDAKLKAVEEKFG